MARRYSVQAPPRGGGAKLIRAGGGSLGGGSSSPKSWFSTKTAAMSPEGIEVLKNLFGKNDAIRKRLVDTGIYTQEAVDRMSSAELNSAERRWLEGAPARAATEAQTQRDIAAGEFRQKQEKLISEPMNWPGSLYDPSIGDQVAGERREVPDQVPDTLFEDEFPSDVLFTPKDLVGGSLDSGPFEWFRDDKLGDMKKFGDMKKHMERDEEGRMHGTSTEWREDGSVKSSSEYNHGEEVSRIEYDKQGNIEKTTGDPFKTKEEPAQKTTDALAALFQGLDPRVASEVLPTYRKTQEALRKEPVVPAMKVKETTKTLKDGSQVIERRNASTGDMINKFNVGKVDAFAGETIKSFQTYDANGNPIQVFLKLDRDLQQVGDASIFELGKKKEKGKVTVHSQSLDLAAYLQEKELKENYNSRALKDLPKEDRDKIIEDTTTDALNPYRYLDRNRGDIVPFREYLQEVGKFQQINKLLENMIKLGDISGGPPQHPRQGLIKKE